MKRMKKKCAGFLAVSMLIPGLVIAPAQVHAENEKVTITFGISDCTMEDGIHTEEFSVLKKIAEETGVEFDFVNYDTNKFRTLSHSGDLPDLFVMADSSMANSLIEAGYVQGLNDLIEEYGPNVAAAYAAPIEYETKVYGDTYFFPYGIYSEDGDPYMYLNGTKGFFSRYDIYKAIGSPEITDSREGYLDVLEQMQAYARDYYGDENIYAFSSWNDWALWPYICVYPCTVGYADLMDINHLVNSETGEFQDIFLDTDGVFWDGIEFFNEAYQRGLFDPEGLVQSYDQYTEKLQTGKTLVSFISWMDPDASMLGEDACFAILPNSAKLMMNLTPVQLQMGNRLTMSVGISSNCKNPEAVIRLYNWANTTEGMRTLANGVQGETWDYVDGVPAFIGTYAADYLFSDDDLVSYTDYHNDYPTGIDGTHMFNFIRYLTADGEKGIAEDGYPYKLMNMPEYVALTQTVGERKFAEDFGCTYPGEVYKKWKGEGLLDYTTNYLTIPAQLLDPPSDDVSVVENKAIQYFMANVGDVILAESNEAFETAKQEMVDEMVSLGLDEASATVDDNIEKAKELAGTFSFE